MERLYLCPFVCLNGGTNYLRSIKLVNVCEVCTETLNNLSELIVVSNGQI